MRRHLMLGRSGSVVSRTIAAAAILSAVLLSVASPAEAVTGPTVIAVHQNGAVDVPGGSVLGRIASVSLPAGNWLITATATVIGTTFVNRLECQLIAGNEFYKSRTRPSGGGVASYQPIVLILAHHFAKAGSATLACYTDQWLGADLIRDVHVTAVQVGQLVDGGTTTGTGSPKAYYAQDTSLRGWTNNAYNLVQKSSASGGHVAHPGCGMGRVTQRRRPNRLQPCLVVRDCRPVIRCIPGPWWRTQCGCRRRGDTYLV